MSPLYVVVVNDVVEIGILCYWPLVKSHLVAEARNHLQKHLTRNLTLLGLDIAGIVRHTIMVMVGGLEMVR